MLYVLLTEPALAAGVRAGDNKVQEVFIEEVLRVYGVAHFRPRRIMADTTLLGVAR